MVFSVLNKRPSLFPSFTLCKQALSLSLLFSVYSVLKVKSMQVIPAEWMWIILLVLYHWGLEGNTLIHMTAGFSLSPHYYCDINNPNEYIELDRYQ